MKKLHKLIAGALSSKEAEDAKQLLRNHIQRSLRAAGVTTAQGFMPYDFTLTLKTIDAVLAALEGKDPTKVGPNFRYKFAWKFDLTTWGVRYDGGDLGWCTYVYDLQSTDVDTPFGKVVVAILYRSNGLRTLVKVWPADEAPAKVK